MFERLTNRTESGIAYTKIPANESNMVDVGECYTGRIIDRLAAYEDSGLSPEEVQELKVSVKICEDCWNHAQAKADGRLVVLPCKVGDTVYKADFGDGFNKSEVRERIVRGFKHTVYSNYPFCDIADFGKTVFLTREEAEKVLEGSE